MGEGIPATISTTTTSPASSSSLDHDAADESGPSKYNCKASVDYEEEEEDSPRPLKPSVSIVRRRTEESHAISSTTPNDNEGPHNRHQQQRPKSESTNLKIQRTNSMSSHRSKIVSRKSANRAAATNETGGDDNNNSNQHHNNGEATYKNLPPPRDGEYDVVIPLDSPFLVECTKYNEMAFAGFRRSSRRGGNPGTAERYGFVRHVGDVIVAVGGQPLVRETGQSSKEAFLSWQKTLQDTWCGCGESGRAMHVRFRDGYYRGPTCLPREAERKHLKRYIRVLRQEYHDKQGELHEFHQFLSAKERKFEKLVRDDISWMAERTKELAKLIKPNEAESGSALPILSIPETPLRTNRSVRVPGTGSSLAEEAESPPSPPPLLSVVEKEQPCTPPQAHSKLERSSSKQTPLPPGPPKKRPLSTMMTMHRRVSTDSPQHHGNSNKRLRQVPPVEHGAVDENEV